MMYTNECKILYSSVDGLQKTKMTNLKRKHYTLLVEFALAKDGEC